MISHGSRIHFKFPYLSQQATGRDWNFWPSKPANLHSSSNYPNPGRDNVSDKDGLIGCKQKLSFLEYAYGPRLRYWGFPKCSLSPTFMKVSALQGGRSEVKRDYMTELWEILFFSLQHCPIALTTITMSSLWFSVAFLAPSSLVAYCLGTKSATK